MAYRLPRTGRDWAPAAAALLLLGCGDAPAGEQRATARQALLGGRASDAAEDAAVRVEEVDADGTPVARCSGYAVAPNLVVTARHCALETPKVELRCLPDVERPSASSSWAARC